MSRRQTYLASYPDTAAEQCVVLPPRQFSGVPSLWASYPKLRVLQTDRLVIPSFRSITACDPSESVCSLRSEQAVPSFVCFVSWRREIPATRFSYKSRSESYIISWGVRCFSNSSASNHFPLHEILLAVAFAALTHTPLLLTADENGCCLRTLNKPLNP